MEVNYTSKVEHPSNCQGQGAFFMAKYALNFKYQTLLHYLRISSQWHTVQTAFGLNPTNSTRGKDQCVWQSWLFGLVKEGVYRKSPK